MHRPISAVVVCVFLSAVFYSAEAYDTDGKFGMGIKIWGTPVITFSTMKLSMNSSVDFEPGIGYYQFKSKNTYTETIYSGGTQSEAEQTYMSTNSILMLSGLFNCKAIKEERANLLVRLGGAYSYLSSKYERESESPYETDSSPDPDDAWNVSLMAGLGIEHFFTDNFAVNVGILSGWSLFSDSEDDYSSQVSILHVGNQIADFSLVFYLK
jgi:opacity protein-like surface antigen